MDDEFAGVIRAVVAGDADGHWAVHPGRYWCQVIRTSAAVRMQGWKIHLSAQPTNMAGVLSAAAAVLVAARVQFKFVGTKAAFTDSLGRLSNPGASGKFITAYPADDDQFARLITELHEATAGFDGPRILSDQRYGNGIVYYRYGQFVGHSIMDDLGRADEVMMKPDGSLVVDQRRGWYERPPWAPDLPSLPVRDTPAEAETARLTERFVIAASIRHTNRGGVLRARERSGGRECIIKYCRAGVDPGSADGDGRDILRHEARMLTRLAGVVPVPELVDVFDIGAYTFLVQTFVPGRSLAQLIFPADDAAPLLPDTEVHALAGKLIDLAEGVHRRGMVIGDLTPANLMVRDDELVLIDTEGAGLIGTEIPSLRTEHYAAPENDADGAKRIADPAADRYAVGRILEAICLQRPPRGRLQVEVLREHNGAARALAPIIEGLTATDPASRWSWAHVRAGGRHRRDTGRASTPDLDAVIDDALIGLLGALRPRRRDLLPNGSGRWDHRSAHSGAAGVTSVLVQAHAALPHVPAERRNRLAEQLGHAMTEVSRWWDRHLDEPGDRILPGLFTGHAGMCWAAAQVAAAAQDGITLDHALTVAATVPTRWHIPTIAHGTAGAGLMHDHLWRMTGDDVWRDRALDCARHLVDHTAAGRLHYPQQRHSYHGLAVGTAGIGAFLLTMGREATAVSLARDLAGAMERRDVVLEGEPRVAGWWTERPDGGPRRHGWWSGPAGIASFLGRAATVSGDPRLREAADAAAVAVRYSAVRAPEGAFEGLAGDGHALLDLEASSAGTHRRWACLVTDLIAAQPVAGRFGERHDLAGGVAGILSYLLRFRYGVIHPWLTTGRAP